MKLALFLSGTCFGLVAGTLLGYLVLADERNPARSGAPVSARAPEGRPDPHAAEDDPEAAPLLLERLCAEIAIDPVIARAVLAEIEAASATGSGAGSGSGSGPMSGVRTVLDRYRARTKADPRDRDAWVALASAYAMSGHWSDVAGFLENAVTARPEDTATAVAFAQALYRAGRPEEALERARALIARDGAAMPAAHGIVILAHARAGRAAEARAAITAARAHVPDAAWRKALDELEARLPR